MAAAADKKGFDALMARVAEGGDDFDSVKKLLMEHKSKQRPKWMDYGHVLTFIQHEKTDGEAVAACRSVANASAIIDGHKAKKKTQTKDYDKLKKKEQEAQKKFTTWRKQATKGDCKATEKRLGIGVRAKFCLKVLRVIDSNDFVFCSFICAKDHYHLESATARRLESSRRGQGQGNEPDFHPGQFCGAEKAIEGTGKTGTERC